MKKKLVVLAGVVAAAWGVKKLMQGKDAQEQIERQYEQPDERLAA